MNPTTNESLLRRVRDPHDSQSWREFSALYRPVIERYARAKGLSRADAEDIAQECLQTCVKRMPRFEYCRSKGRFSSWMRTVAENKIKKVLSKRRMLHARTSALQALPERDEGNAALWKRLWLREHLRSCLRAVEGEHAAKTFQAFKRTVIDEWPVNRVCTALGMNRNQVYLAKSRVLRRLRERMVELVGYEV